MKWGHLLVCAAVTLAFSGCGTADSSSIRAAVAAGLVAGPDAPGAAQTRMFKADIRSGWAVAYDPASPPGCEPGGLWGEPDGPALPEAPCTTWVLVRRKNRWMVSAHGRVGSFDPPAESPKDLGDPTRLVYLSPGD